MRAVGNKIGITILVRRPWIDTALVRRVVRACLAQKGGAFGRYGVSLILVGDQRMCSLNRRTFGRSGTTDVIAFPLVSRRHPVAKRAPLCGETLLGEVFISVDRVEVEAARRGIPPIAELLLYVAHGVLHLVGYDDTTIEKTRRMRIAERRVLAGVIQHRYLEPLLRP